MWDMVQVGTVVVVSFHGAKRGHRCKPKQVVRHFTIASPLLDESTASDTLVTIHRCFVSAIAVRSHCLVYTPNRRPPSCPPIRRIVSGITAATGSAARRALPASAAPAGRRRTTSASTATDGRLTRPSPSAPSATTLPRTPVRAAARRLRW